MKQIVIIIMLLVAVFSTNVYAGELDAWEFRFFGVNYKDFEDRNIWKAVGGMALSLVAHETGHYVMGEITGGDSSMYWNSQENMLVMDTAWDNPSDSDYWWTASAGFLTQTLIGGILTAIPATRHSDWTVGFNAFSSLTGFFYGITGGVHEDDISDVQRMNKYGGSCSGTAYAYSSFIINGYFTYISLDKYKEEFDEK
jgi:hypothetical protein